MSLSIRAILKAMKNWLSKHLQAWNWLFIKVLFIWHSHLIALIVYFLLPSKAIHQNVLQSDISYHNSSLSVLGNKSKEFICC